MKKKLILSTGVLMLALSHAVAGAAGGVPDYYPNAFAQWGVITNIDAGAGRIVINDLTVPIAPDLKVYTPTTRHETQHVLRIGMRVAYGAGGARAPGTLTELWVLPADFIPSRIPR
jgi:hypothetical protein